MPRGLDAAARQLAFRTGNRIDLLTRGSEYFAALELEFSKAEHEIFFESYIFHVDDTAMRIADAMIAASQRGVQVHVLLDGFGSSRSLQALHAKFEETDVSLLVFRPIGRWYGWWRIEHLRRLHRKLCVVDGKVAFVSGINIIDDQFDVNHGWFEPPRLDWAVRIEGPLVQDAESTMHAAWVRTMLRRDWSQHLRKLIDQPQRVRQFRRLMVKVLRSADDEIPEGLQYVRSAEMIATMPAMPRPPSWPPPPGAMRAALALRNNLSRRRTIERAYIEAIGGACKRIVIVTPYFFPGIAFRRALADAARRGVNVELVLQGRPDFEIARLAARALYADLLRAGVHIHEYTSSYLHGKVAFVDDTWATVGSSNIDPLSLLLAREANVVVTDAAFNRALAASVDAAIAGSRVVEPADAQGSFLMRIKSRLAVIVVRLFIAFVGGARRY